MVDEVAKPRINRVRPKRNKLLNAVKAVEDAEAAAAAAAAPPVAVDMRGDPRADMRGDPRGLSPREAAEKRTAEILAHIGDLDEGTDEFYIDPAIIPDGWSYEWKRHLLLNKEDPAYEVALARSGWTAVPASRHPQLMPHGTSSGTITRKGQVLMERPAEITARARAIEAKKASAQVRGKEEQLSAAPQGQFARDNKGNPLAKVGRQYEAVPIPAK